MASLLIAAEANVNVCQQQTKNILLLKPLQIPAGIAGTIVPPITRF